MAGKAGRRARGAADGPASVAVAAWLSAVIAGDSAAPPPLDSAALALLRHGRLTALAASTASGDPRLAGVARDAFALAMLAQHAAAAAVAVLEAGGIETLTLKGPAFAVQILDDAALRPSGDVDLLVRRADLPAVRRACAAAGMRGALHYPAWYEERWHDHAAFSGPPGARLVTVEVHWDIVRPGLSRLPVDQVFASRVDVACGGETLPAAALPWQAVFAAAHAAQHFFDGRGLLDVALAGRRLDRSGWAWRRHGGRGWGRLCTMPAISWRAGLTGASLKALPGCARRRPRIAWCAASCATGRRGGRSTHGRYRWPSSVRHWRSRAAPRAWPGWPSQ